MSLDPAIIALTGYIHSFFCLSPTEARLLAVRAMEIAGPLDDEADVICIANMLWRVNRDADQIEESDRHVPICVDVDVASLPETFVLGPQQRRPLSYPEYRTQPRGLDNYEGFASPATMEKLRKAREESLVQSTTVYESTTAYEQQAPGLGVVESLQRTYPEDHRH